MQCRVMIAQQADVTSSSLIPAPCSSAFTNHCNLIFIIRNSSSMIPLDMHHIQRGVVASVSVLLVDRNNGMRP